jgi:hypothetical protein
MTYYVRGARVRGSPRAQTPRHDTRHVELAGTLHEAWYKTDPNNADFSGGILIGGVEYLLRANWMTGASGGRFLKLQARRADER